MGHIFGLHLEWYLPYKCMILYSFTRDVLLILEHTRSLSVDYTLYYFVPT